MGPPTVKATDFGQWLFYLYFGKAGKELVSANSSEIKLQAQAVIQSEEQLVVVHLFLSVLRTVLP